MNESKIKEIVSNKRTALRVGVENVVIVDANKIFGFDWDEAEKLRWIPVPVKGFWNDLERYIPKPDSNFYFDETATRYALAAYELGRPVMMTGPTGSGKSDFFKQFMAKLRIPAIRVQGSDDLDIDYLFGAKGLKNGNTVFEEGVLTYARRNDIAICLDEVDSLRENVQLALNGYLENSGSFSLAGAAFNDDSAPTIETTGHQPIWATSNTGGKSQAALGFHGTRPINKAVLDRFVHIDVDYLPAYVERKIIAAKCTGLDDRMIGHMIQVASIVRQSYKAGQLDTTISTRSLIDWGNFSVMLGMQEAFKICAYAQVEPSDRGTFKQAYATGMGRTLELPKHLQPQEAA